VLHFLQAGEITTRQIFVNRWFPLVNPVLSHVVFGNDSAFPGFGSRNNDLASRVAKGGTAVDFVSEFAQEQQKHAA
jgi:hypothetical protein